MPRSRFASGSFVLRRAKFGRAAVVRMTIVMACVAFTSSAAAAQSCGSLSGRYVVRVQPGLLAFPSPTPDDFAAGWIEHGPVTLNIRPRGNRNRPWVVCMRADSPEMGGGKPVSDLEYRRSDQATWTAMSTGDQTLAQGDRGERVSLEFRIRLDSSTDPAGSYRADYTVTASRP